MDHPHPNPLPQAGDGEGSLLSIDGLRVGFSTRAGFVEALRGVSLSVRAGETLGLVGESGSGKSVTAYAATGLLDRAAQITGGRIVWDGRDITGAPRRVMRPLRGAAMSTIFQNPRAALNPIRPIGLQIADALRAHSAMGWAAARLRALELLDAVRIRDAASRLNAYPHELSGGMCQRVMIAVAIACSPRLLIADEPTTGLDVTTQAAVMDLLADIVARERMALILITHDLGLAAQYCGRIAVMEAGRVVEEAPPDRLFGRPGHPYTRRLVAASPRRDSTLESITEGEALPPEPGLGGALLEVRDLVKRFDGVDAVKGVSFTVHAGESLGLVGESGSGKSTISRMVCRLLDTSGGSIRFAGEDIGAAPARQFHKSPLRSAVQIVFQDPGDSLNPRFSAADSIADPLRRLLGLRDAAAIRARVEGLAIRVGLERGLLDRFPHQLSGGQKARVGIARAIAAEPRLLVLDEPTAALDVSVQAVVLLLLERLRRESGMAFLFVSHDLNVVRMMCRRVVVLQAGAVVEAGLSADVLDRPAQPYTRELVAAIPHFSPSAGV